MARPVNAENDAKGPETESENPGRKKPAKSRAGWCRNQAAKRAKADPGLRRTRLGSTLSGSSLDLGAFLITLWSRRALFYHSGVASSVLPC